MHCLIGFTKYRPVFTPNFFFILYNQGCSSKRKLLVYLVLIVSQGPFVLIKFFSLFKNSFERRSANLSWNIVQVNVLFPHYPILARVSGKYKMVQGHIHRVAPWPNLYQNCVEFHHRVIGHIVNLPTPTRSSDIYYEQSYLWSHSLSELVTFIETCGLRVPLHWARDKLNTMKLSPTLHTP